MRYVSARERNILLDLANPNKDVTLSKLALANDCSERTIRRDLQSIEAIISAYDLSLVSNEDVYWLQGDISLVDQLLSEIPYYEHSQKERILLIFKTLLQEKDYVKYAKLQSDLNISLSVLTRDLEVIQSQIELFQGTLEIKRSLGVKMNLSEEGVRKTIYHFVLHYLRTYNLVPLFSGKTVEDIVPEEMANHLSSLLEINHINKYVNLVFNISKEEQLKVNDATILQVALYIAILVKRSGHLKDQVLPKLVRLEPQLKKVEAQLGLEYEDLIDLDEFLQTRVNYDLIINYDYQMREVINEFVTSFLDEMNLPSEVDRYFYEDALNWYQKMLDQDGQNIFIEHAQAVQLFDEYPYLAKALLEQVEAHLPRQFNPLQVAELLMFLVATIEELQINQQRNVLVVCIGGMGSSRMIVTRLKNQFPNLNLKNISLAELSSQEKEDYDFIVSTVSIDIAEEDVIKVSPLLFEKDVSAIKKKMQELSVSNENRKQSTTYSTLITMDQTDAGTVDEMLTDVLSYYEQDYFCEHTEEVKALVLANRPIGFGIPDTNIAIFHTRNKMISKQLVSFVYSSKPITLMAMNHTLIEADKHIIMLSTDDMTEIEKNVFNTISILALKNETFRQVLEEKDLAKIIEFIEAEL